jgi:galacturan 1,4-alpha-galacturonidase
MLHDEAMDYAFQSQHTANPAPDPQQLKIAYIGGGSRGWARNLMNDLACSNKLGGEVALYDIDLAAAALNAQLATWLHAQPGALSAWRYRATGDLGDALSGAHIVVISVQPGTLDSMAHELQTSEKYGRFYPVGDTVGAPGLMRGLRAARLFETFAHAIQMHCPHAWVINYSNPMTICTRTLTKAAPALKVFGCCHGVFETQHMLAEIAREQLGLAFTPGRHEIALNIFGINHFTWADRAMYQGQDLLPLVRAHMRTPGVRRVYARSEVEAQNNWFHNNRQIGFALFERFGVLPAISDRHLTEFVPGFVDSVERLFAWGVIRTPMTYRRARWADAPRETQDFLDGRKPWLLKPSDEEIVPLLCALLGMGGIVTNLNLENSGQIPNLPLHAVVETNAHIDAGRALPIVAGSLPPGLQPLIARHVANQELIVEAALTSNADLAFQAIYSDPTVNLPIDVAWGLFNDIGLPAGFS